MRNTTRCCAISARAVSGSLMSSAGATTMPQPMLSGSQMSMMLPSERQGSTRIQTQDCWTAFVPHAVLRQDATLKAGSPKMKGIVWKNMEPAGMGAVQVR